MSLCQTFVCQISQLRAYRGPRYDLAPAEQFLLYVSDIPDYRTLLAAMLFRAEFNSKSGHLRPALQAMITACRDILHSPRLRDFVKVMTKAGNFLNAVSFQLGGWVCERASHFKLDDDRQEYKNGAATFDSRTPHMAMLVGSDSAHGATW